ncbi:MAG: hypothetical protein LBS33_04180 [Streptococcaceae bacterium]|jgi:hypothetical protein|nr:hypothetical protein [Streptococcaceae bacterium]
MGWQGIFDTLYALFGRFGVLLSGVLFKAGEYGTVLGFYSVLCLVIVLGRVYGRSKRIAHRRII